MVGEPPVSALDRQSTKLAVDSFPTTLTKTSHSRTYDAAHRVKIVLALIEKEKSGEISSGERV